MTKHVPLRKESSGQQSQRGKSMVKQASLQKTAKLPSLSELDVLAVTSGAIENATAWLVEALPNEQVDSSLSKNQVLIS